jgi:CHRD domain-containing protein
MRMLRLLLPLALVTPAFVAGPAEASPSSFIANMTAEEVQPVPGPPGAKGTARVVADQEAQKVCYQLTYHGPGSMSAAHIHRGEKGMTGPVTINLDINAECVSPNPAEIKALVDWPDGYYVEIHTIAYPQNGAVRGQTVPESGGPPPDHQPKHQH